MYPPSKEELQYSYLAVLMPGLALQTSVPPANTLMNSIQLHCFSQILTLSSFSANTREFLMPHALCLCYIYCVIVLILYSRKVGLRQKQYDFITQRISRTSTDLRSGPAPGRTGDPRAPPTLFLATFCFHHKHETSNPWNIFPLEGNCRS